jgi:hypothetical protein
VAVCDRRLREKGSMMPDGLKFVGSWVTAELGRDDITLLRRWIVGWSDLMAYAKTSTTS